MRKVWAIAAVGLLVLAGVLLYAWQQMQPPLDTGQPIEVIIEEGASPHDVGVTLAEKELIKNPTLFKWKLRWEGTSGMLKAGKYYVNQGMTMEQIANVLVQGDPTYNTVKFTVPEGLTVEGIADTLAEQGIVDREAFLTEVREGQFDYDFLKEIPANDAMKYRLEGYLFPETYEVFKDADAHEVVDLMLKQTATVLTPEWREQAKVRGLSVHQALTLASLVEREARVDKERPTIAGVIDNRLKLQPPMKLQIDATVQFALGKTKENLLFKDLEVESPYNTYLHEGLPPGPISNSGRASIQAALTPEPHGFYFYVTKNDGSGEHLFAVTFEEHEQNIAKSQ